ncbi:MAG: M20/M25/M40 family metallo-hydrolase [Lachnospiraceae bacterium]|nr:M20/M25/M40 family metallo-hydrolase [Lachnospiraceae bacterium]
MAHKFDPEICAKHLSGVVQFPTVSDHDEANMDFDVFFGMHRYLEETYPLVHKHLKKEVVGTAGLLYHWQGTGESGKLPLMFMAHQDVVPEGDHSKWKYPPYAGTIAEGYIWGRGASDCKSHLIAQMEAVEYLLSIGYQPSFDIYLAYGYNEEVGSGKGEASCAQMISRLLESRGVRFEGILDEGGGLRAGKNVGVDVPVCMVIVAEKGYADYEISRKDPGGHSSKPGKEGAMYHIAKAIMDIEENPFPYRITETVKTRYETLAPYMKEKKPELAELMTDIEGNWDKLVPMIDADRDLASMFHTTMAITMASGSMQANILPEKASIVVNCRLLEGDTLETVEQHFKNILPEGLEVKLLQGNNPSPVSEYKCAFKDLLVEISGDREAEMIAIPDITVGGTDAKFMYNLSDHVYRFSSFYKRSNAGGVHSVNETMGVEDLASGPEFYVELVKRYGER